MDADASVFPDATEICDGVDNDCDGTADPAFVSGDAAACAIGSTDAIQCWGWEGHNELLFPSGTFSLLGIGGNHGCAVDDSDGSLQCWGRNDWAQATLP